jgi:enoyl-CoA hydratase/carnithine racemase
MSLLVEHFGTGRALDLVLRARLLDATEAAAAGFVSELCDPEVLDDRTDDVVRTLLAHAPLTMWAAKEAVRRLGAGNPADDDIIARVYASNDFRAGVAAFKSRGSVEWTGG